MNNLSESNKKMDLNFDFSYVDLAFRNGTVITVDQKDTIAQAVGVKNNKIVFVGSDDELDKIIDDKTRIVDLHGRALMPGFVDSHFHPILSGLIGKDADDGMIDTFNCPNLQELLGILSSAVIQKKPGEWISSMGYNPCCFPENRYPTLAELDALAPDNPVHCMTDGGHVCVYNSKALAFIGIHSAADAHMFPAHEIEVVAGELTGLVRGHTHFKLWGCVDYTEKQQKKAALRGQEIALQAGITSVHDAGEMDAPSYHIMQKLCREGIFRVRVYMMLHSIFGKEFSARDNDLFIQLGLMTGLGDEHFRIGSSKFMIDGGSASPSCATRDPFCHDPALPREKGWERQEVANYLTYLNQAECQATAHAIGDLAIEYMVEGYRQAFVKNPRPDLRHRIEHCTLVDQDLLRDMAEMNICPSVNAGMLVTVGSDYRRFYGDKRMEYLIALRSMLDAGIRVSISSDSPSESPPGITVLDGAINRYCRATGEQLNQNQCISVLEAIRCATLNGAYASYEEHIKGSIEVGKLADLIILDQDILAVDPMDIHRLQVDMTVIDGQIEYHRCG
jgi:predicted amidohydrolase YtcJ